MLRLRRADRAHNRALQSLAQYTTTADPEQLNHALSHMRQAVGLLQPGDPPLAEYLSALGDVLSMRFDRLGEPADIEESVATHRRAIEAVEPGTVAWAQAHLGLGTALYNTFRFRGRPEIWDEAIRCYRAAMTAPGGDADIRASAAANLGSALVMAPDHADRAGHQQEALTWLSTLVEGTSPDHPNHLIRVAKFAALLAMRLDLPDREERLEPLLAQLRERLPTADPHVRKEVELMLGGVLTGGSTSVFRQPTAAELIEMFRAQVAALPTRHALRPGHLSQMALAMAVTAEATGKVDLLDEVITTLRQALRTIPADLPDRPVLQSTLGSTLGRRLQHTGRVKDLPELIDVLRAALEGLPADHPDRGPYRAQLGNALRFQYQVQPRDDLLETVLDTFRAAERETPPDHQGRGMVLTNLGGALVFTFERRGHRELLDEAVAVHREAVRVTPESHQDAALYMTSLGEALNLRFERQGRLEDLDEAIRYLRRAVELTTTDHAQRGLRLSALGMALMRRANHVGDTDALAEATELLRLSATISAAGQLGGAGVRKNLALALMQGAPGLGDPVELLRGALAMAGDGPNRADYLSTLGMALLLNVNAALAAKHESALSEALRDVDDTALLDEHVMGDLARRIGSLPERGLPPEAADDLDEAVDMLRQAVIAGPADHAEFSYWQASLGMGLQLRGQLTGDSEDLREAVDSMTAALQGISEDSPRRAYVLTHLAYAHAHLAEAEAEDNVARAHRRAGIATWRQAATTPTASAHWRAEAARNWGREAADIGDFADAVEGFTTAVGLLDLVAWRGLSREDQERLLADFQGVAGAAAACAIQAGMPERAVELLEQGRGVLLAQALDMRAEHEDLEAHAPDLAEQLADTIEALAADSVWTGQQPADVDRRHRLGRALDDAVAKIRELDGFEDFLRPPRFSRLVAAADGGPVVVVNVSRYRCDALVIETGGVGVVPLPDLTEDDVTIRAIGFDSAIAVLNAKADDDLTATLRARQTVTETLRWMWDTITGPVLEAFSELPQRLWWCPTGRTAFLPLHASGDHSTRRKPKPDTVIDRVASSYTPTVRALAQQRRRTLSAAPADARPLVVAMPNTPGFDYLPGAAQEAVDYRERFPRARSLVEDTATRDAVIGLLDVSPWVHFACHAVQAPGTELRAWLVLADQPLTARDLAAQHLADHTDLAFLSSCETARGDEELADEMITVAAAVQLAGYRHVIASQWTLTDFTATDFGNDVYGQLTDADGRIDTQDTALAVHHAVHRLRERHPFAPLIWAPYTHTGP
ncbi:CHAT domain-containing protein [Kibdelosporangium aridum]|uniref:CHAT domain-containing protein n=1 Tax=Kibdelosporangium aridum TaxID=2030 RepID=A0A428Z6F7_KIBAR|nr:CHAT domain-containing protein [Kibdelosporangium aridum]RSM82745.1 CHAT domain-containing protein [Kibdelosporangium aridum]